MQSARDRVALVCAFAERDRFGDGMRDVQTTERPQHTEQHRAPDDEDVAQSAVAAPFREETRWHPPMTEGTADTLQAPVCWAKTSYHLI